MTISNPPFSNTSQNHVCQRKNSDVDAMSISDKSIVSECLPLYLPPRLLVVRSISCCTFSCMALRRVFFLSLSYVWKYSLRNAINWRRDSSMSFSRNGICIAPKLTVLFSIILLKSTPLYCSKSELPCIILKSMLGRAWGVFSSTIRASQKRRRAISTAPFSISTPYMFCWMIWRLISAASLKFSIAPRQKNSSLSIPIGNAPEPMAGSHIFTSFRYSSMSFAVAESLPPIALTSYVVTKVRIAFFVSSVLTSVWR